MQYVLFNPQAGNGSGAQQARALDARFPEETFSYTDMTTISDYAAWLGTLPADASLIIAGGDGTLNRFLNDTDGMALPEKLYYFATGSGNDFLHDLGLEKGADPVPVTQYLRDLPTVTVNGKHWRFLNGIGYGIDGYCCEVGDALRGKADKPVNYTAIAIKGLLFHFHPANAEVTVDGKTYALPDPFIVLATQNPVGSAGTTMLPNSQLDRFLIRVSMGYPDHKSSVNILRDRHIDNPLDRAYAVVNKEELLGLVQEVRKVDMRDPVLDYVTTLVEKTRNHPQVALGVSPRGALAVCRMAKAFAYLHGRDFVMPEDGAAIFPDVCAHRLMLNSKARMMEEKPESVLAEILKTTDMPVLKK